MAETKKINPWLKLALELGPIAVFFIGFGRLKDATVVFAGQEYHGFILMTALFVPLMLLTTGILWKLTGKLSKMQVATVVLVVVFGGLSVWFNDERFFKMKPTMIYVLFAAILGFGLWRGESYLKLVMDEALPMQPEGWMILTRRITLFFAVLAVANEVIWRMMSTEAWVNFKTFGLTGMLLAFIVAQTFFLAKHIEPEKKEQA